MSPAALVACTIALTRMPTSARAAVPLVNDTLTGSQSPECLFLDLKDRRDFHVQIRMSFSLSMTEQRRQRSVLLVFLFHCGLAIPTFGEAEQRPSMTRHPHDWSVAMLVHRWKKPLVLGDSRIRIVVGSPEEALTWLIHEPNQSTAKWQRAWEACRAVIEGRMRAEDAKPAVQFAASR